MTRATTSTLMSRRTHFTEYPKCSKQCYALLTVTQFYHNRRSELTFKEEQWQKRQESLEKRISELEDSLQKGKTSNSSQSETPNADKKNDHH